MPSTLYCTFCGKSQFEVRKLIAGPTVFICDECVELCNVIIDEDTGSPDRPTFFMPPLSNPRREATFSTSPYFEGSAIPVRTRHVFWACPFHEPFDSIYAECVVPAFKNLGWTVERSDEIYATGAIIRQIWEAINRAEAVVADVSGKSSNVMYEMGLSHALHKPVMIVTQSSDDVPFDLRHHRFLTYANSEVGRQSLVEQLGKMTAALDIQRRSQGHTT